MTERPRPFATDRDVARVLRDHPLTTYGGLIATVGGGAHALLVDDEFVLHEPEQARLKVRAHRRASRRRDRRRTRVRNGRTHPRNSK